MLNDYNTNPHLSCGPSSTHTLASKHNVKTKKALWIHIYIYVMSIKIKHSHPKQYNFFRTLLQKLSVIFPSIAKPGVGTKQWS